MYQRYWFHIRGVSPCMTKNGQTANRLNEHAKAIAEITGKRKKSDADLIELSKREFLASFYLTADCQPGWAGECIEGLIRSAARRSKQGKLVEAGVFVDGTVPLIYKGPKSPLKLWECPEFVDVRNVAIGDKTVSRTRPIFREWELKFTVSFDGSIINAPDLYRWIEEGGRYVGLSDFRPKFGRFVIVEDRILDELEAA